MTEHNAACECCRKRVPLAQIAASVSTEDYRRVWCFTCWDADPRAIEQYRQFGVPVDYYESARENAAHNEVNK